jgi:hypothetical protein
MCYLFTMEITIVLIILINANNATTTTVTNDINRLRVTLPSDGRITL